MIFIALNPAHAYSSVILHFELDSCVNLISQILKLHLRLFLEQINTHSPLITSLSLCK